MAFSPATKSIVFELFTFFKKMILLFKETNVVVFVFLIGSERGICSRFYRSRKKKKGLRSGDAENFVVFRRSVASVVSRRLCLEFFLKLKSR